MPYDGILRTGLDGALEKQRMRWTIGWKGGGGAFGLGRRARVSRGLREARKAWFLSLAICALLISGVSQSTECDGGSNDRVEEQYRSQGTFIVDVVMDPDQVTATVSVQHDVIARPYSSNSHCPGGGALGALTARAMIRSTSGQPHETAPGGARLTSSSRAPSWQPSWRAPFSWPSSRSSSMLTCANRASVMTLPWNARSRGGMESSFR